jgi:hypothetical protein
MRRSVISPLLAMLAPGCSAPRHSPPTINPLPAHLFPPDALVTQRGVLTVRGRQFPLNGYIAKSETRGLRLIVSEDFGGVLADVLVKPDGKVFVMHSKPPFRPAWVESYIAADLKCIFGDASETNCPVQMPDPSHFVVKRRWYRLELRTVETKPGVQPAVMFDEAGGGKP